MIDLNGINSHLPTDNSPIQTKSDKAALVSRLGLRFKAKILLCARVRFWLVLGSDVLTDVVVNSGRTT